MEEKTLAQQMGEMIAAIEYGKLSAETIHLLKRFVLDYLGCALAGSTLDSSQTLAKVLAGLPGEQKQSAVIGQPVPQSLLLAALLNGAFAHGTELDDDHREAILHPAVVVVPAALAVAEREKLDGQAFLPAVLAGYELIVRTGNGLLGQAMYAGWHLTGVCGVFGAAAAAGKLLELNAEQLARALSIAASSASGLFEYKSDGSWTKRFHPGKAARSGILAAYLAKEGFSAPDDIFEGRFGFYQAYVKEGLFDLNKMTDGLGTYFSSLETSIKTAACCRFCQPVVDCSLDLAYHHNIDPGNIERIHVKADKFAVHLLTNPRERVFRPQTVVDAQFSIPYAVAVSLVRKQALLQEFTPEAISDPQILEVAAKITWEVEPEYEKFYPKCYPSSVTIWTKDGREYSSYTEYPKGDPENMVSDKELKDKFIALACLTLANQARAEAIYHTVFSLETKQISELTHLLS